MIQNIGGRYKMHVIKQDMFQAIMLKRRNHHYSTVLRKRLKKAQDRKHYRQTVHHLELLNLRQWPGDYRLIRQKQ